MGPAVLPGAGAGCHGWRLRRWGKLLAFMVFQFEFRVIFRNDFYLEL